MVIDARFIAPCKTTLPEELETAIAEVLIMPDVLFKYKPVLLTVVGPAVIAGADKLFASNDVTWSSDIDI